MSIPIDNSCPRFPFFALQEANSSLEEAQVICIGEFHTPIHTQHNHELVQALQQPGDCLLLEEGAEEDYQDLSLPQASWDIKMSEELSRRMREGLLADRIVRKPSTFAYVHFVQQFEPLMQRVALTKPEACKVLVSICCRQIFARLFTPCLKVHFARKAQLVEQEVVYDTAPARNGKMVQEIDRALVLYKRVFVIAGRAHFVGAVRPGFNLTVVNESAGHVLDYLRTKRFVLLVPKPLAESS